MEKNVVAIVDTTGHEENSPIWRSKDGEVKMSEMTNAHLQKAFTFSQRSLWKLHLEMGKFSDLVENLEAEAKSRGLNLTEYDEVNPKCKLFIHNLKK
jgi:hypothetical protein